MKRLFKRFVYAVIILGLLGLLAWSFVPKPVEVDAARVQRGRLQVTVDEEGKTRIKERYRVAAPLEGQLQRITLDPGDTVEAMKTVLAIIEPMDPALLDPRVRAESQARVGAAQARLEQTEPQIAQAEAELEIARREHERLRALPIGNVSQKEIDDALSLTNARTAQLRSTQIARDIASYQLEQAQMALRRTFPTTAPAERSVELLSPVDGKVLWVFRESGTPVTAGTDILEVGNPRDLEVEMEVLSTEAVKVQPGDRVRFVRWGGDDVIDGIVRLIEPQAFTKISALGVEEQRVKIISDLTGPPHTYQQMGDAFRVDGQIIVWEEENVLIVPTSALFRRAEQWQVFVVADGATQVRDVKIGHMSGLSAEVLEGLQDGDLVIVHPSDQVSPGVRVQLR